MKKLSFILLLAFSQITFAQVTRFVYQVTTMPDSTDLKSVKTEIANLDVTPQKSIFYGDNRLKRDSIMERMRLTKNFDRNQLQDLRSNVNYIVEKDLVNHTVVYKDRIGRDQYAYNETEKMNWKILPETVKIGDYKTQKAETRFGGRTWYAWFTTDIPIQDGPYKFNGLPGLIVKVQDKQQDYSFDLMQTKKIAELPTLQSRGQTITIPKEKYYNVLKKFQSDPVSYMSANSGGFGGGGGREGGGGRGGYNGGGGRGNGGGNRPQMDVGERQKRLDEIKNNNNPIEFYK